MGEVRVLNVKNQPVIRTADLKAQIAGAEILKGVTFEVAAGEVVGIIGPNGSGKTTMFNVLSGFVKASGGQVFLKGQDITPLPAHVRSRRGLGRVFQNSGVFRDMTVIENVVLALECHEPLTKTFLPWGPTPARLRREALGLLEGVKLADKANNRASSLSGGQLRLLEIVRTIAFRSDVCLLDEPTAGVSPKMKDSVAEQIVKLKDLGKTVLVIEHDMAFIQQFCNRILVIDAGIVALDGTPEQIRSSELLRQIYFGAANA